VFVKDWDGCDYCVLMEPEIPTITNKELMHPTNLGCAYIQKGIINVKQLFHGVVPELHYQD